MATGEGVSGKALAVAMVGVVFAYSAIKGKKLSTTIRDLIYGKNPSDNPTTELPVDTEQASQLAKLLDPTGAGTGAGGGAGGPAAGSGTRYSYGQLVTIAEQGGFSALTAPIAAAVALAESGGNPNAIGDKDLTGPGEESVGLWQINYRPWRDKGDAVRDPVANLNPQTNAHHAFQISGGGVNFRPWTTYNTGAYRKYLP